MRFTNDFYHIASGGQAYIYKADIRTIEDMSYRLKNMQYYQREMLDDNSSSRQQTKLEHIRHQTFAEYRACDEL